MTTSSHPKRKLLKFFLNKYLIVTLIFTVIITFFGEYSLLQRWETYKKIQQMESELRFYQHEIEEVKRKKNELQSSDYNLEKFAREHYFMKYKDEDVFIIKE